MGVHFYSK